jgi:hypothetical protein
MSLYVEGDVPYIANGNCNNGNGFGDGDWIWAFLLFALLGNGAWGGIGGGYGGGRGGVGENYVLATDFATIERKLDGVNAGLCDGFYAQNTNMLNGFAGVQSALCQGFNGLQQTVMNGFHGVDNSVCTLGYQTQAGFNTLANQIASCCCDLKTMNLENRYLNERQTCDIVAAINAGNQRLVDIYTTDKLASKDARIAALEAQISNAEQSAYLLNELKPCPKAAYVVQPPQQVTFPTNCCGNVSYAGYGYGACGASVQ